MISYFCIKSWFLDKIAEHKLTSRKYKEMKSLMNMLYDFAVESNLVSNNVSRMVHGISYKKYAVEQKKPQRSKSISMMKKKTLLRLH